MTVRNISDLDKEILSLENEELTQRDELIKHIVTPSALLHTTGGLFMRWVRLGSKQGEQENQSIFSKLISILVLPLTLIRSIIPASWHVIKSTVK